MRTRFGKQAKLNAFAKDVVKEHGGGAEFTNAVETNEKINVVTFMSQTPSKKLSQRIAGDSDTLLEQVAKRARLRPILFLS